MQKPGCDVFTEWIVNLKKFLVDNLRGHVLYS